MDSVATWLLAGAVGEARAWAARNNTGECNRAGAGRSAAVLSGRLAEFGRKD